MENVFYMREDNEKLSQIRELLLNGEEVEIHNCYDTFYGCGFDSWLRKGLADILCEIEETSWNHFPDCGYPWTYVIRPRKEASHV